MLFAPSGDLKQKARVVIITEAGLCADTGRGGTLTGAFDSGPCKHLKAFQFRGQHVLFFPRNVFVYSAIIF